LAKRVRDDRLLVAQELRDLARRIDHVGSTSVQGLAGKDVIDIQITVRELDRGIVTLLTAIGYVHLAGFASSSPCDTT
jgi:GrpB-like predicted nucleotidyltransferase (UPF0157 family)